MLHDGLMNPVRVYPESFLAESSSWSAIFPLSWFLLKIFTLLIPGLCSAEFPGRFYPCGLVAIFGGFSFSLHDG